MRRYAKIRLFLAVLLPLVWILFTYLNPLNMWLFPALLTSALVMRPFNKIRNNQPILSRVALWIGGAAVLGMIFWMSHLLDQDQLDAPSSIFFGMIFLATGIHHWSCVCEASDQEVDEVFGNCLGSSRFKIKNDSDQPR